MTVPTISAVMTAYNAEEYIGESLTAILSQTCPPVEVIVVDDGSTDGTPDELERFRGDIHVVRQSNRGHAHALNRGFGEARGDFIAKCDSDDIWESSKIERQAGAIGVHPEIDIAFAAARIFGQIEGQWAMSNLQDPSVGVMDRQRFGRTLYSSNPICPSTTLIRRRLYEKLGPFVDSRLVTEDYEYWLRALGAGALFYYDPEVLVHYRRHENNVSSDRLALHRSDFLVRSWNADVVDSRSFVNRILARDLFHIARDLSDQNRMREARAVFVDALRLRPTLRALVWVLILSIPERIGRTLADALVSTKHNLMSAVGR